jgi:hypothetical protein
MEIYKQINNRISFKHLYHSYLSAFLSAREFQMGNFPEILIAKCRSRFYCTWFFCWGEIVRDISFLIIKKKFIRMLLWNKHNIFNTYLLTLPLFTGVSRVRALSPAWTGSLCAGDINLPHTPFPPARSPPNKKIKYNKIFTYILQSIFLEIPHLELLRWWKTPRDTNGKGV